MPGTVRSTYALDTAVMAGLVDPSAEAPAPASASTNLPDLLSENKLSREWLPDMDRTDPEAARVDRLHRRARDERMETVTDLLNDGDVDYASMKNLRTPKAMMSDIDLLIADPSEQAQATLLLHEAGFEFVQFRLLANPLKTMCTKPDVKGRPSMSGGNTRPVDIYPEAAWIRKLVCDATRVVDRADPDGLRSPSPEDDLYLVATHAYSHLSLRFAELFHGVAILENADSFDWSYLQTTAHRYGCRDALYAYLRLVEEYCRATGRDLVPEDSLAALGDGWIGSMVDRWFASRPTPISYPVEFPIGTANVVSSMYHSPLILRRHGVRAAYKDFQSHYLVAASKLLTGET